MAARIEQARGFHTGLVLAPQVVQGMGDENETARILGSVETVICHRVNTPEDIIMLAGTHLRMEYSHALRAGRQHRRGLRPRAAPIQDRPEQGPGTPTGRGVCHQSRARDAHTSPQAPDIRETLPKPVRPDGEHKPDGEDSEARATNGPDGPAETTVGKSCVEGVPVGGGVSVREVSSLPF